MVAYCVPESPLLPLLEYLLQLLQTSPGLSAALMSCKALRWFSSTLCSSSSASIALCASSSAARRLSKRSRAFRSLSTTWKVSKPTPMKSSPSLEATASSSDATKKHSAGAPAMCTALTCEGGPETSAAAMVVAKGATSGASIRTETPEEAATELIAAYSEAASGAAAVESLRMTGSCFSGSATCGPLLLRLIFRVHPPLLRERGSSSRSRRPCAAHAAAPSWGPATSSSASEAAGAESLLLPPPWSAIESLLQVPVTSHAGTLVDVLEGVSFGALAEEPVEEPRGEASTAGAGAASASRSCRGTSPTGSPSTGSACWAAESRCSCSRSWNSRSICSRRSVSRWTHIPATMLAVLCRVLSISTMISCSSPAVSSLMLSVPITVAAIAAAGAASVVSSSTSTAVGGYSNAYRAVLAPP
mmetsp:Transcript_3836/g.12231  ORF Transcript_3836/g.12231 Transcript_3836/m.12231 type:complete len:417 (-) Transcript_3836:8-1258(-)